MPTKVNRSEQQILQDVRDDPGYTEALLESGGELALLMVARAPVHTRNLKEHIAVELVKDPITGIEVHVGPTTDAFYGRFQETGTENQAPQPFMRPAADELENR